MMKGILGLFLMFAVMGTTEAQKKKELTTPVNVNYCLPKVVYEVEVVLECARFIPGPYRNYAEKELGIKPEITSPTERWSIEKMDIKPRYVPDEKAVYSVSGAGDYTPMMLALSAEGFLAGVAGGQAEVYNLVDNMKFQIDERDEDKGMDMMKLSTYNNLKEVLDTNYILQEVDGVMKKIWDPIIRYTPKSEADNVKEAITEIFRIRSERLKLLGAENNVPDGKSLEIILKEFEKMERNYLNLFMGKKEVYKVRRVFTCIPEKADEPVIAFRFSEKTGIADSKNVEGMVYSLKIEDAVVPASTSVGGETTAAVIYYRVPATGALKLLKGKEEMMSFPAIIPQLGEIKKFPVDIISNEGLVLEFYPQFGSLKSIKRK